MRRMIVACFASFLISGSCLAQGANGPAPTSNTSVAKQPAAAKQAAKKPSETAAKPGTVLNDKPTTSKISFQSRPSGARIALSNGRSCVTPCSFIVGYNEKFTGTATKAGYAKQELDVSPSITQGGKAYIVGMAIGAGVIGLAVGAASAPRAYGPEPIVVEMVPTSAAGARVPVQSASYTDRLSPQ